MNTAIGDVGISNNLPEVIDACTSAPADSPKTVNDNSQNPQVGHCSVAVKERVVGRVSAGRKIVSLAGGLAEVIDAVAKAIAATKCARVNDGIVALTDQPGWDCQGQGQNDSCGAELREQPFRAVVHNLAFGLNRLEVNANGSSGQVCVPRHTG